MMEKAAGASYGSIVLSKWMCDEACSLLGLQRKGALRVTFGQRTAVITGVGIVAPGCLSFQDLGHALLQQRICCSPIVRFCTDKFKTKLAFQVDQAAFSDPSIPDAQRALIVQYGRRALA